MSVEAYHKKMENLIEYREGVFPEDNTNSNQDDAFTLEMENPTELNFLLNDLEKQRVGLLYSIQNRSFF